MSPVSHWIVRTIAIAAAILVPLLVLAPPEARAPSPAKVPTRALPAIARATPAASTLPALFGTAPSTVADTDIGRPVLLGVAGRLPDDAEAMIRLPGEPTRAIRRGDTVMGWTLTVIAADRAVFTRGAEQHVSTLDPVP